MTYNIDLVLEFIFGPNLLRIWTNSSKFYWQLATVKQNQNNNKADYRQTVGIQMFLWVPVSVSLQLQLLCLFQNIIKILNCYQKLNKTNIKKILTVDLLGQMWSRVLSSYFLKLNQCKAKGSIILVQRPPIFRN